MAIRMEARTMPTMGPEAREEEESVVVVVVEEAGGVRGGTALLGTTGERDSPVTPLPLLSMAPRRVTPSTPASLVLRPTKVNRAVRSDVESWVGVVAAAAVAKSLAAKSTHTWESARVELEVTVKAQE
jgi:hypothetical protein